MEPDDKDSELDRLTGSKPKAGTVRYGSLSGRGATSLASSVVSTSVPDTVGYGSGTTRREAGSGSGSIANGINGVYQRLSLRVSW